MMAEMVELEQLVHTWPPAARKELLEFVAYLQHKYSAGGPREVIKLGGLWADIPLDVTDQDVRALRQKVTYQLRDRI